MLDGISLDKFELKELISAEATSSIYIKSPKSGMKLYLDKLPGETRLKGRQFILFLVLLLQISHATLLKFYISFVGTKI